MTNRAKRRSPSSCPRKGVGFLLFVPASNYGPISGSQLSRILCVIDCTLFHAQMRTLISVETQLSVVPRKALPRNAFHLPASAALRSLTESSHRPSPLVAVGSNGQPATKRKTPQQLEPVQGLRFTTTHQWWPGTESNRRHGDFQSPALPTELPGQCHGRSS